MNTHSTLFVITLLSPNLVNDLNVLQLIKQSCEWHLNLIPIEVSRIGLEKFDYTQVPTITNDVDILNSFQQLKQTLAKPLTPHANSDQVTLQLQSIWKIHGISYVFFSVPKCSNCV